MPKKVLIVDDDPVFSKFLESALSLSGYQVILAGTGRGGLEKMKAGRPDLLLLDIKLPDMEGWDVCVKIREDTDLRSVPIIMMSSVQKDLEDRLRALRMGAVHFLPKPFKPDLLKAKVDAVLRVRPAGREKEA